MTRASVFALCWRLWRRWLALDGRVRLTPSYTRRITRQQVRAYIRHIRAEHHEEIDHG